MSSVAPRRAQLRQLGSPRVVTALALFGVSATLFCALAAYVLVRQADAAQGIERRAALLAAVTDLRDAGTNITPPDVQTVRALERAAGLKDLRFDSLPTDGGGRETQPVLGSQGRILGWFSWQPEQSMTAALGKLQPLLAVTALCLIGFAGLASWRLHRAVSELGFSERRAWKLAHEDMLTGLPNHRKMIELIDAALQTRGPDELVTFALIDIDGLNDINDTFGHAAGDRLLKSLADRLREVVPAGASAAARVDGDEFAILLTAPDASSAEAATKVAAMALARPFWIDRQSLQIQATTGFAHAPLHAGTRDELMRRADLALRAAKRSERGAVLRFDPSMETDFNDRLFIERELRRALHEKALQMHYQPVVTSDGARISGVEALLRWNHPERGAIPPSVFVPVAEQTGLMAKLGDFALRRALADARRWPSLTIAVNLSPTQVYSPDLVEFVSNLLADYEVPPSRLVLEVTESVLMNPDEAQPKLEALRKLGVRLALDDFGTGYSSLAYLQRFRFDTLKIDRAFVAQIGRSSETQALIQAIVALGRALGMTLLAEGVETEEQRVLLRLAGCQELQGFLFARPSPREAIDELLQQPLREGRKAVAG